MRGPDEFTAADAQNVSDVEIPVAVRRSIHPIDGTRVSWYGSQIAEAIRVFRPLLSPGPSPRVSRE